MSARRAAKARTPSRGAGLRRERECVPQCGYRGGVVDWALSAQAKATARVGA